jgi:hypothetical protein
MKGLIKSAAFRISSISSSFMEMIVWHGDDPDNKGSAAFRGFLLNDNCRQGNFILH